MLEQTSTDKIKMHSRRHSVESLISEIDSLNLDGFFSGRPNETGITTTSTNTSTATTIDTSSTISLDFSDLDDIMNTLHSPKSHASHPLLSVADNKPFKLDRSRSVDSVSVKRCTTSYLGTNSIPVGKATYSQQRFVGCFPSSAFN